MHSWSGEVLHDLKLLIQSRYGIVHLDSNEEDRVQTLLRHTADSLGVDLFLWSPTRGLGRAELEGQIYDTIDPAKALRHVASASHAGLNHFRGLGPHLEGNSLLGEHLREAGATMEGVDGAVILTGYAVPIPDSISASVATLSGDVWSLLPIIMLIISPSGVFR